MMIAVAPAYSQEGRSNDERERDESELSREDIHELIDRYRFKKLSKNLELDEEETVAIMKEHDELRDAIQAMRGERRDIRDQLRAQIEEDASDEIIEETLGKLITIDRNIVNTRQEAYETLSENCTVAQQAKFYIFMHEFDRDIRRLIMKVRRERERNSEDEEEARRNNRDDEKPAARQEGGDPDARACLEHSGESHFDCTSCLFAVEPGQFIDGRLR
jgi:hypothetical protein